MITIPHALTTNITNLYGDSGSSWLMNLQVIMDSLSNEWNLSGITPVDNMTYHYVAKAMQNQTKPVVIKVGYDEKSLLQEKIALDYFNGEACIRLLDYSKKHKAFLLEQAVSGVSLKSYYPRNVEFVMDCYVRTMQKLHQKELRSRDDYLHIRDWLTSLDTVKVDATLAHLFEKGMALKNELLKTIEKPIFLHGDLHHDNIIKHGDSWVAIDPKGIIGDAEFEIAAFDFIHPSEFENQSIIADLFQQRILQLAKKANLNAKRIKDWVFVRLLLSAAWSIEDHGDPSRAMNLAKILNENK